ncbi:MAG: hypothetical protein KBD55_01485 [Candidatus Pacebacteria bacterium]|nr:hypothetical protein [Candidatus Paceibacterota bacterium]
MQNQQKGSSNIVLAVVLTILVLLLAWIIFFEKFAPISNHELVAENTDQAVSSAPSADAISNWKTYTNTQHGFELKYPSNWVISDTPDFIQISNAPLVTDSGSVLSISIDANTSNSDDSWGWVESQSVFGGTFFSKKVHLKGVGISVGMSAGDMEIRKIQDKILSTLKFDQTLNSAKKLPVLVEAKRQEILKATEMRDYKKLASLISSSNFLYLIEPNQGDKNDFEVFLRQKDQKGGKSSFEIISTLLNFPYDSFPEAGVQNYVWPDVFLKSPKTWTTEDWDNMKKLYSEKEIESQKLYWDNYVGYRIGIDQNGNWVFYFEGTD